MERDGSRTYVSIPCKLDTDLKGEAREKNSKGYLENMANSLLEEYLPDWHVAPFTVRFSTSMTSSYGWCRWRRRRIKGVTFTSDFRITLSYRLCYYNTDVIASVLWHEICHVLTPGERHSQNFWELVDELPWARESYSLLHGGDTLPYAEEVHLT